jgi:ParB-like chromosome segregation protein Spo0J
MLDTALCGPVASEGQCVGHCGWRQVLPVHPAALIVPANSKDKLIEIGRSIKATGMIVPVVIMSEPTDPATEGGVKFSLLDGQSRLDAMELVGIKCTIERTVDGQLIIVAAGFDIPRPNIIPARDIDPYAFVTAANVARRHLNREAKRKIAADLIEVRPDLTDRAIAGMACLDHKTIAAIRKQAQRNGEIPHNAERVEKDGRRARGRKPALAGRAAVDAHDRDPLVQGQPVQGQVVHEQPVQHDQFDQVQPVQIKVGKPAAIPVGAWVNRIVTLAGEASALLTKPTASNIETVRRKLAEIRNCAKNRPTPVVAPNTTKNITPNTLKQALGLHEPKPESGPTMH